MASIMILFLSIILSSLNAVTAIQCEEENFLGMTTYKTCPGILDPSDANFCCGPKDNRRCCQTPFDIDDLDLEEIAEKLPAIIGALVAVVFGLILVCILCCCCCPFCLIHKRKNRGAVHQPPPAQMQPVQPVPQQQSQAYAPVQQTGPYAPQPGPYPTQPMPGYGGPPPANAPYPTGAPYPVQTSQEQPPPYSEKQSAYNPNY